MKKFLFFLIVSAGLLLPGVAKAQPTANFTATPLSGCSPILVQFTDQSTGSPTSWNWNLGNGVISTLQNPTTTYINPGTYTVTLTVTNAGGSDTKTLTSYITVQATPTVSFAANDSSVSCAPKTVTFTNTTQTNAPGAATYIWDFGDGTTSTAVNPTKTYNQVGNYTVSLTVTNSNGCTRTLVKTAYISTTGKPAAAFTAATTSACSAPFTASFTNSTTPAAGTTYAWSFGDGGTSTATNPTHTYSAPGAYTVRLIATNAAGCKDTLVRSAYINISSLNTAFSGPASVCAGSPASFTSTTTPSSGTTYAWNFGDGTTSTAANPTKVYTAGGTYTVRQIATNGFCADTAFQTIVVNPKPTANFTGNNLNGCTLPHSVTFTNFSTNATSYQWSFGDGGTSTAANPTHSYTAAGTYSVTLVVTGAGGCKDTLVRSSYVSVALQPVTITATPPFGCTPFTTTLSASVPGGTVTSYSWSMPGGSPTSSTSATPSVTYNTTAAHAVTVNVTTNTGCTGTASATILTGSQPSAAFTATPTTVCVGNPVTFTNNSTNYTSVLWNYGDGTVGGSSAHQYGAPGVYTVTLIVGNNSACYDTLTIPNMITVNGPIADFTYSYPCSNRKQVTFTNTSSPTTGVTYLWNFGDGNTSTAQSPTHTYLNWGNYAVTLSVTGPNCTNIKSQNIKLGPLSPAMTIQDSTICRNATAVIYVPADSMATNQTVYASGVGVFTPISGAAYVPIGTHGVYTVKLVSTDAMGCKDSITKTNWITVGGPVAQFNGSPLVGCAPLTTTFTDASTSNYYSITSRGWSFGNSQTLSGNNTTASTTYTNPGAYTVSLTVTDAEGCTDIQTRTNYVQANAPIAGFSVPDSTVCANAPVTFTNTTTGATGYSWNFGNGQTSTAATPTVTYTTPGAYTVRLIATTAGGCADTIIRTAYINVSSVTAAFVPSDTLGNCPPLAVAFTNTSTGATNYAWMLGNGATSSLVNPGAVYTIPGTYTVKLKATSAEGCVDSTTRNIVVQGPYGSFTYTPQFGCSPLAITFTANTINTTTITWDMGNGNTVTMPATGSYTHTFTTPGVHMPAIILSNGNGCSVGYYGVDTIHVSKVYAGFTHGPTTFCNSGTVAFNDTSLSLNGGTYLTSRLWNFGNGQTSTAQNPTATYTTPGTYTVSLIATNNLGCADTAFTTVTVLPKPSGAVAGATAACAGAAVTLTASGGIGYNWSPSAGLSCVTCANPTVTVGSANQTYTVITTGANGCSDTDQVTVGPFPTPTVSVTTPAAICSGTGSATLTASGAATYAWSPATGLSATTGATVTASPASTTTYTVTGTSADGCVDTAQVTVTVSPTPVLNTGGGVQNVCNGASVTLNVTGATTYSWTPATGLSCTNCSNPTASPTATTTYTVTGTTGVCSTTAQITVNVTSQPTVTATGGQNICAGGSATLSGGGANSYVWSPSTGLSCTACANPVASPTSTTTYTVTGTAAGGCTGTAQTTVTIVAPPTVDAGAAAAICAGGSTTLTATGATAYTWSPGAGLSTTTGATVTANPSATTVYTVTGTTFPGCVATDTVSVNVNALPVVTPPPAAAICIGGSAVLTASGAATYVWSPATGLSSTTGATVTASPTSTTSYTVTGTSAAGCVGAPQNVTVTVNPQPTVSATAAQGTVCAGASTTLTATGATTYSWSPSTGLSSITGTTVTATPTATTTYTVIGTASATGCADTATVTVNVTPLPVVTVAQPPAICAGGNTALTASGTTTYSWSPATGLSATTGSTVTASPTSTTTYVVTGTANGCQDTAHVTVVVNPLPTIAVMAPAPICPGSSATLTATGGSTYSWSPSAGLSATTGATVTAIPASTSVYTVTGTSAAGCVASTNVTVTVRPTPPVSAGPDAAVCNGQAATLTASGAVSYVWSPSTNLSSTTSPTVTATPTTTTTYVVTGTDTAGCVGVDSVVVNIGQLPTVAATAASPAICVNGSTTLTATGGSTYSWSPSTGLSSTTGATVTATPTTTTTYVVTGTNAQGCQDTGVVTVTVNPLPTPVLSAPASICPGDSTTLTATGAGTYSWSPSAGLSATSGGTVKASPATTTTYTVTGTSAAGCLNNATVQVTVLPKPNVSAGPDAGVCNGQAATLTATGAVSYVWSPSTGLSSTTTATVTASPTSTTTYVVTGTGANGCVNTDTVVVNIGTLPTVAATAASPAMCAGSSTTLTATGANAYSWSPATGLSSTSGSTVTATPTATTTYVVTGTNAQGCSDTGIVTVTVNPLPVIPAAPAVAICPAGSTILTVSGAATYSWSPATGLSSTTGASVTASPAVTTIYTITGTSADGCTSTQTRTVTVLPLPAVNAGPDAAVCSGQAATLTATGAATYVWSPATGLSSTTSATVTASPFTTTTYVVTGTATNGCVASDTVVVNIGTLPTVSAGPDATICAGAATTLNATGASTYVWTPATGLSSTTSASPTASPAATTTYVVTGTNSQGCSKSDTVVVTVNPLPTITTSGPVSICPGLSSTLTASGAASYVWSPSAGLSSTTGSSVTATPTATTTYTVTGTGSNGCVNTATVTVTLFPAAAINAGADAQICIGASTTLTATGGATYVWSPSTGLSSTTAATVTANPTTTTTYTVTGTTANGCVGVDSVKVTVNPLPVVNAGPDAAVCAGVPTTLTASGAATYSWSPGTGLSSTTGATVTANPASTTTYTVTGTSAAGCVATDQVTVTVRPLPTVSAGPDKAYCVGGSTTLTASGASTYVWSPATSLSSTTAVTVTANPASTTTYTLTGTDQYGCVNTDGVTVTVNPLPNVDAGADVAICERAEATLTATGAVSYVWSPGATLPSTTTNPVTATPTTTTTYTVVGTDANGCVNRDTVRVSIVPRVPTAVGPGDSVCRGESAQLSASGGVGYQWYPATGLDITSGASVTATPNVTTTYFVIVQQNQCYRDTLKATVVVNPVPTVDAGPDQTIASGSSANLFATATDASIYAWTPGEGLSCDDCLTPVATPKRTTTYRIDVSNQWGCKANDEVVVKVTCDLSQLFIPNTFTPNGDGQNDRFYPRGKGIGVVNRFRIYNRWGELMYDMSNIPVNATSYGWDGTFRGQPLKPDVYVWVLEAQCESGDPLTLKGDISLIR